LKYEHRSKNLLAGNITENMNIESLRRDSLGCPSNPSYKTSDARGFEV
jgi:hypothetical protein